MSAGDTLKDRLSSVWGDRREVADVGLDECFRYQADIGFDQQLDLALRIGIMTGETNDQVVEVFVRRFEAEIIPTLGGK